MNPEKAEALSPELPSALEPLLAEMNTFNDSMAPEETLRSASRVVRCRSSFGLRGHRLLAKNPLSNNVGGVKQSVRTPLPALEGERHFALVDGCASPTWARSNH
jgi:hypothetical protein